MPYCEVGLYKRQFRQPDYPNGIVEDETEPVNIFYHLYGQGDIKVLLIMGLAATHDAWEPQISRIAGTNLPNEEDAAEKIKMHQKHSQSLDDFASLQETQRKGSNSEENEEVEVSETGIQICALDNRGVGKSSAPRRKSEYTTAIMAMDALAVMDHLGWKRAHVFGHSMGAMISWKLAAMVPDRIASLALLSGTGGGYQCLPKFDSTLISIAYRFFKAKSPEERALVDLDTHYTQDFLDAEIGGISRRDLLYKEYVRNITASGMQPKHGLDGQVNACWTHRITSDEVKRIHTSSILVSVIHGRGDIIAQIRHSRSIAKKLHPVARMLELPGGHLVTHENTHEVNQELLELIQTAQSNVHHSEWNKDSALPKKKGWSISRNKRSRVSYGEEQEEEDESTGCFAFLNALCRLVIPERCSCALKRLYNYFVKQKQ